MAEGIYKLITKFDGSAIKAGFANAKRDVNSFSTDAERSLAKLERGFYGIGTKLSLGLTAPLLAAGGAALKLASDAEEIGSKFETVFKQNTKDAEAFAEALGRNVGRAQTDLKSYLATLQDTFVPLGFARDKAADLSKELTALAIDVASFNNQADATVLADFQSALVGNTETVRKYGIVITAATTEQKALELGLAKTKKEISEQDKVYARYIQILEGSTDAQGDAARTAGSAANSYKAFQAALSDTAVEFGENFLPIATQGLQAATNLIRGFSELDETTQDLIIRGALLAGALGPLAIGLGQVVTSVRTLTTAFTALKIAALPILGPAGLIVGGAALVGGLAIAFMNAADRSGDLTDVLDDTADAVGSASDKDSVIGAIDALTEHLDGPAKTAMMNFAEEARNAKGDLDDLKTAAANAVRETQLATLLIERSTLEAQLRTMKNAPVDAQALLELTQENVRRTTGQYGFVDKDGNNVGFNLKLGQNAYGQPVFQPADAASQKLLTGASTSPEVSMQVLDIIEQGNKSLQLTNSTVNGQLQTRIDELTQSILALADTNGPGSDPPKDTETVPGSSTKPKKTPEQLAKEDIAGIFSDYYRDLGDLQNEFSRGLFSQADLDKDYLSLVSDTITELQRFDGALLSDQQRADLELLLKYEQQRLKQTQNPALKASSLAAADLIRAEYLRDISGVGLFGDSYQPFQNPKLRMPSKLGNISDAPLAAQVGAGVLTPSQAGLNTPYTNQQAINAMLEREQAKLVTAMTSWRQEEINLVNQRSAIAAALEAKYQSAYVNWRQSEVNLVNQRAAIAEAIETRYQGAYLNWRQEEIKLVNQRAAVAAALEMRYEEAYGNWRQNEIQLVNQRAAIVKAQEARFNEAYLNWRQDEINLVNQRAAIAKAQEARFIEAYSNWRASEVNLVNNQGAQNRRERERALELFTIGAVADAKITSDSGISGSDRKFGDIPGFEKLKENADKAEELRQKAADNFAQTVVNAGFTFTENLVSSIASGDIGAAFKAAIQGGQSILGAADFGTLDIFGGKIGIGSLLAGGLGLAGGLFDLLFPKSNSETERRTSQRSNASSFNLSVVLNSEYNFNGNLTDPATKAAVEARERQTVKTVLEQVQYFKVREKVLGV